MPDYPFICHDPDHDVARGPREFIAIGHFPKCPICGSRTVTEQPSK